MPPREGPYKTRIRVSDPQRILLRAMSPRVGIKRTDIKEVSGRLWKQIVNSLVRKGFVEWGNIRSDAERDRLFLTERGRSYRERYIHAAAMGDLSLIGNGYRELKEEGKEFGKRGPWVEAK